MNVVLQDPGEIENSKAEELYEKVLNQAQGLDSDTSEAKRRLNERKEALNRDVVKTNNSYVDLLLYHFAAQKNTLKRIEDTDEA